MTAASKGLQSGSNARIGLLMATRDQPRMLQAVRSLLTQTHQNFTLTIVDDGSQPQTRAELAALQDPRITVVHQSPQGFIPALNIAIKKSKPAAFYGVVYAACFYAPHYLAQQLNALMRYPHYSGAYCHFCEGDTGIIFKNPFFDSNALLLRDTVGPGLLFRASAFQAAGNLFLSEKQGIFETWQRMVHKSGPLLQVEDVGVRWYPHPYDTPPPPPEVDFDKQVYPHVQASFVIPEHQSVDSELLVLLSQTGHQLIPEQEVKTRSAFILCGNFKALDHSFKLAQRHQASVLFALNDRNELEALQAPQNQHLLASSHFLTRQPVLAQGLEALGHPPSVYMPQMTRREVKRLLCRFPALLHQQRCVIVIRAMGGPELLEETLKAIHVLHRPPAFADLLVFSLDANPQTLAWLEARQITHFAATRPRSFGQLLFLLKQLPAQYVLNLDAGMIPARNWITELMPLLTHPRVGMVSGLMNDVRGTQRLDIEGKSLEDLQRQWQPHHEKEGLQQVSILHDGAFMVRKSVLEYVLANFPDVMPLSSDYLFCDLLTYLGFSHFLNRRTLAFNSLPHL